LVGLNGKILDSWDGSGQTANLKQVPRFCGPVGWLAPLAKGASEGGLTVHVDDLAVVGEDSFVDSIISSLGAKFKIGADKDLHHFLSIKLTCDHDNKFLYMSQSHYIDDMVSRFLNGTHTATRAPTSSIFKDLVKRTTNEDPSPGPYSQLIGSLLWISQCTRPDVSFAVNKLSQFLRDPSSSHWSAALKILNQITSTTPGWFSYLRGLLRCRLGQRPPGPSFNFSLHLQIW
jgi:hypothetical protein